ncbi:discoidin domain-containing protein [Cellulomonas sp. URHD0024]|uniref:discoidin domain-containing protein n=1 Tax=Cellulomonas sp. URHD0024 TaxID=1302620 RepID=UPI000429C5CE|nr:discoidin domain-containing protein [Cellulomonas sp. URHD0024]
MTARISRWALLLVIALVGTVLVAPPSQAALPYSTLVSLGKPTTASSVESPAYPASAATDGQASTRWSSANGSREWLQVDLQWNTQLDSVSYDWAVPDPNVSTQVEFRISDDGTTWTTLEYDFPQGPSHVVVGNLQGFRARYVSLYTVGHASVSDLSVYGTPLVDFARGKPTTASSVEGPHFPATAATDGLLSSRWSSQFSDPQWIVVDIRRPKPIVEVDIVWETAYARSYRIDTSLDGVTWTTVSTMSKTSSAPDHVTLPGREVQFLRVYATARGTQYGVSIRDLQILGPPVP